MTSRRASWPLLSVPACIAIFAVFSRVPAASVSPEETSGSSRVTGAAFDTLRFVVHVSVDGLRGDAVPRLGPRSTPHFHRMMIEGAATENARTDYNYTITLPNHACELTGRSVLGAEGHGLSINSDDGRTLEAIHGSYVAGVFDVAHDHGLRTALYASKSKFALFDRSWNESHGAQDITGEDDGRDKIDIYRYSADTGALIDSFIAHMTAVPAHYSFIHITDPDEEGHSDGWESDAYFDSVVRVDGLLGRIFDLVEDSAVLAGRTWIIVVADHGGFETNHGDASNAANYTIPFYVWGPGVPAGADLYYLNAASRLDPDAGSPPLTVEPPPIRNGEAANLSLDLLGLGPVPGSSLDAEQDNDPALPGGTGALPSVTVTNPAPGAIVEYPSLVMIEAAAAAEGGDIECVEFFANYVKLGEDPTSPYAYEWSGMPFGSYRITARAIREDGIAAVASTILEVVSTADAPAGHSMLRTPPRIYPNPAAHLSTVAFSLARGGAVEVAVYDLLGRRIGGVFDGRLRAGAHELRVDADRYAPGLYFLALRSGNDLKTGKLMIVR